MFDKQAHDDAIDAVLPKIIQILKEENIKDFSLVM